MTERRFAIIANPAARAGKVGRRLERLRPGVDAALGDVHWALTTHPGHARELASEWAQRGDRVIVALGGDGTLSEVCGGVIAAALGSAAPVPIGLLPAGTGGDFRRLLAPTTWQAQLEALRHAPAVPIDAGIVQTGPRLEQSRAFVNIASFGIGGLVDELVNSKAKHYGGRLGFFAATLAALRQYTPAEVELWADGEWLGVHRITNVAVANGQYFGGGMHIAPAARLADGFFELVVVPAWPLLESLARFPAVYRGKLAGVKGVVLRRARHVRVIPRMHDAWLDIDGEPGGPVPAEFRVLPGALSFIGVRPDAM